MSDDLSGDMLAPSWPNLVFCRFDEASAIRKAKMMFSITGSQIVFADFVICTKNGRNTSYQFIVHTTNKSLIEAQ